MPVKIFFCYAHEDEAFLNKLKTQMRPFQRQGLIDVWHDRDISAGTEWEQEITEHLNHAQIILLLVSPDFMDSDYCYGIEMKNAIERHKQGKAIVIPIILYHVHWQGEPLGNLQALPTDAKPVTGASWHSLNEALFDVAEGIRKVVDRLRSSLPKLEERNDANDHFTLQARQSLSYAQEEAELFHHNYIGTEHLLLGLLRSEKGVAVKILVNLGIDLNKIRLAIEFVVRNGERIDKQVGLIRTARMALELAIDEASIMHHNYVGTEHLLIGLLRVEDSLAAGLLESLGVDLEKVRRETQKLLT
jgi:hypothetical protein